MPKIENCVEQEVSTPITSNRRMSDGKIKLLKQKAAFITSVANFLVCAMHSDELESLCKLGTSILSKFSVGGEE